MYFEENEKFLQVATESAKLAGEFLKNQFGKKHSPVFKTEYDIGLETDKSSEKIILEQISKSFPAHNVFSEELGELNRGSEYTWYIDPLDGTNNFFAGIAYFSVSIALRYKNDLLIGIVYNPVTDQIFSASLNI